MAAQSPTKFDLVEEFGSIQGEGYWNGKLAYFVRFAGCNLKAGHCGKNCDTDTLVRYESRWDELYMRLVRFMSEYRHMVFTGGEPFLQPVDTLIKRLVEGFSAVGSVLQVETNGYGLEQGGLWPDRTKLWITYSPKQEEADLIPKRLPQASEVKVIPGLLNEDLCMWVGHTCERENIPFYVQPLEKEGTYDVAPCMKVLESCPNARLSVQMHKFLNLR